jgi:Helix-turn-helix domain
MTSPPSPPAEARLLAAKRQEPPRLSMSEAARRAGMSSTRWRQIENGYRLFHGMYEPESAPAPKLAVMARVVGITPAQLRDCGRDDAAGELEALLAATPPAPSSDGDLRKRLADLEEAARRLRADLDARKGTGDGETTASRQA